MITALLFPVLLGSTTFSFQGGTVFDLARKLDDGTGVVVSADSNLTSKIKAFEFKYDDQKDFDRLLAVKSGLRKLGPGAYATRGYPLHVLKGLSFGSRHDKTFGQIFDWNANWPMKESDDKWVLKNEKDEPYRLGLFPNGLAGKTIKMPAFFERLEVIVTSGTYEPKELATKIATALGGRVKDEGDAFEVMPTLKEVRGRFQGTFNEKLSLLYPTDAQTHYEATTLEYSREVFGIAPDSAIEKVLKNEVSIDFAIPVNATLIAVIRKRALAYTQLPDRTGVPASPLQPSAFLDHADWDRPVRACLYSAPLSAGLTVYIKGQNAAMSL